MTIKFSATLANAQCDLIASTLGASAKLRLYSNANPSTVAGTEPTGLLCEITLPSTFLGASSAGVASKSGTWSGTATAGGTGSGTAAVAYRLYNNGGTTCHVQGTVTGTGSGGDLTLDNASIATGQTVTISSASFSNAAMI